MSGYVVSVRELCKEYSGGFTALDRINVDLPYGQIIGLLGPNGGGKTTFIKILAGLLTPTSGSVEIGGYAPGVESKKIVSYLPERTYFNTWMTVKECIGFFEDFYEDFDSRAANDMLNTLGINIDAKLKTLSKGTKEKVQLVLVMSRKAQLYLLDEPIAGVDPAAREFILKTIISNYNSNATVLISTHLISDIEQILDSFVFINQGKIFARGSVDSVREEKGMSLDEFFREVFRCLPNC